MLEERSLGGFQAERSKVWLSLYLSSPAGAFFVPYFIFFFSCGIPVFFLEVALGQYTSQGSVTAWRKICPLFQGEYSASSFQSMGTSSCPHPSIALPSLSSSLPGSLSPLLIYSHPALSANQAFQGPKLIKLGKEDKRQEKQDKITNTKLGTEFGRGPCK